jgi:hypothetical protein
MPTKCQPAKQLRRKEDRNPAFSYRAARMVRDHPWYSGAAFTTLSGLLPFLIPIGAWLFGFVDTVATAKERESALESRLIVKIDTLKAETNTQVAAIYVEVAKINLAIKEHQASDVRKDVGVSQSLLENKLTAAVARVNTCNIMRQGKKMTPLESNVCADYDRDYNEAKRRYENAQTKASNTWQGQ